VEPNGEGFRLVDRWKPRETGWKDFWTGLEKKNFVNLVNSVVDFGRDGKTGRMYHRTIGRRET
jgi:hypothetical protein